MVKPKKHLGQHFLTDPDIAEKIVNSLSFHNNYNKIIEIGAGTGVLTRFLYKKNNIKLFINEIDEESIEYLQNHYNISQDQILRNSFLNLNLDFLNNDKCGVIGNFPYNISSQIFFKVLENRHLIQEVTGMVQKEVGDRLCSKEGSKEYGILSVLLQAYFDLENLFTVKPGSFHPPPKVKSAVIRLKRNNVKTLPCNERLFKNVVKQSFNTRRKTLRNALKNLNLPDEILGEEIFNLRAEQLSVNEFVKLTRLIETARH